MNSMMKKIMNSSLRDLVQPQTDIPSYVVDEKVEKLVSVNFKKNPVELEIDSYYFDPANILFATAILNPFGPTLCIYYIERVGEPKILELTIHPMVFELQEVAKIDLYNNDLFKGIEFYNNMAEIYMPTLFLKSISISDLLFEAIILAYIDHAEDASEVFSALKTSQGDASQRIYAEMESTISSQGKADTESIHADRLSTEQRNQFLQLLINAENRINELETLKGMFIGAFMMMRNQETAIDITTFEKIFDVLASSCPIY